MGDKNQTQHFTYAPAQLWLCRQGSIGIAARTKMYFYADTEVVVSIIL